MITIGFSSHHLEALPYIREHMERHQIIVLEEPPSPHLQAMLDGSITINDYIMEFDSGFPEFDRRMSSLLRELHQAGARIIQAEPYLEKLLQIHELFADGKTADEVSRDPKFKNVYEAEKRATGALIAYYSQSMKAPFTAVVEGVKDFARADAKRLTLREKLRAKAISSLHRSNETMYVEAGYIHYPLYRYLRRELGNRHRIRVLYLLAPVIKKLQGKRRNMGPGDILTLHYAFHGRLREELANMLAARSLIYIKLIEKEEIIPGKSETPHAEDEVKVNRLVDRLNFNQCRELFERIRLSKRAEAVELAQEYVKKLGTKN
ncbi:MAG: hypothetical protein PVH33_12410 [Syntrophobacterales bacterium]|jgi:hypothetical protein